MKTYPAIVAALAVVGLSACRDDDPTFVSQSPRAYVRFVNASPDSPGSNTTTGLTARFVDIVENWPTADGVAFRGSSGGYTAVEAGTRQFRVFRSVRVGAFDTSTVAVLDTVVTLAPQTYYTLIHTGLVAGNRGTPGNTARVTVYADTLPAATSIGTTSIVVRVYHAAPAVGPVDVAARSNVTGSAAATTFSNIAPNGRSAYATVPVLAGTALYTFDVRPAGTATALFSATPNVPGLAAAAATLATPPLARTAGVRQSQSVLSAVIFPAAVPGTPAASSSAVAAGVAATAGVEILFDQQPPQ